MAIQIYTSEANRTANVVDEGISTVSPSATVLKDLPGMPRGAERSSTYLELDFGNIEWLGIVNRLL